MLERRLLVRLPDRPGSLGRVTTLLGRLGIDIREVRILARDGAHATDELVVAVPGPVLEACLVDLLEEVDDVRVLAFEPAQPDDGLVEHVVALAEREPDQPLPLLDVVVEDLGGHRHDAAPFGQ
jgi:ACT domain